jgi:serine/threonine-protein kinase
MPPSEINPDANRGMDKIVAAALAVKPADRYASAREFLDALDRWTSGLDSVTTKRPFQSEMSKATLVGKQITQSQSEGQRMAKQAISFKKQGHLGEAADLMEEAFNKWPELRDQYAHQVKLWRCGVSM